MELKRNIRGFVFYVNSVRDGSERHVSLTLRFTYNELRRVNHRETMSSLPFTYDLHCDREGHCPGRGPRPGVTGTMSDPNSGGSEGWSGHVSPFLFTVQLGVIPFPPTLWGSDVV